MHQLGKPALLAVFLFVAVFANAAARNTVRIKVLDSATRTLTTADNGAPRNCDLSNYDAYCHGSKEGEVVNMLLVQEGDGHPYHITCTNDAKWSRPSCILLTKGETFEATKEKHGIMVYYVDDDGKQRKQLYKYVVEDGNGNPLPASLPGRNKPAPASAENAEPAPAQPPGANASLQSVKCTFSSTPAGAEVTLDGQFIGSTPSVLDVSTGKHVVAVTMPGFAQWKRELTISPGSELTVNAVLQKAQ
jgi:hypothetical protein